MNEKAFQDYYPDDVSHCYGCGCLNPEGLQIKSRWDGDETVCTFEPRSCHTAIPGYVYGGLIASMIDCHGTGTAAAAAYRAQGRAMDTQPPLRFLTASLQVDYLRPTPLGVPLARIIREGGVYLASGLAGRISPCSVGRVESGVETCELRRRLESRGWRKDVGSHATRGQESGGLRPGSEI